MNKKEKLEIINEEPIEELDKSVITSQDVEVAVKGDENALNEQMERIKVLTKEQQLEAVELAKKNEEAKLEAQQKAKEEDINKILEKQNQQESLNVNEKKIQEEVPKLEEEKQIQEVQKVETEKDVPILEQEVNNKEKGGPNAFKTIFAVFMFIAFLAMIYYLPEITSFVNEYKARNQPEPIITDGVSTCTLTKTSGEFEIDITASFNIINSKIYKMTYTTITKGDKDLNKQDLEKLHNDCIMLKDEAGVLDGVTVLCNLNNGINSNKQILDYEKIDNKKVTAAYTEAGGIYPEFKINDDINKVESKMTSSGYDCKRK